LAVAEQSRIEAFHVGEGEVVEANDRMNTITAKNGTRTFHQCAPGRLIVQKLATVQAGSSVPPGTSLISFGLLDKRDSLQPLVQQSRSEWAKRLGIDESELAILGNGSIVNLRLESGELGIARVSLGTVGDVSDTCELAYRGPRQPDGNSALPLVTRLRTQHPTGSPHGEGRTLIDKFVTLESGKPALFGITNLREAIILVFRQLED
jgi:hypothetical protein